MHTLLRHPIGTTRRRVALVLAVAALTCISALVGGVPAQASGHAPSVAPPTAVQPADGAVPASKSSCPSTYFCVWVDKNYSGGRGQFQGNNADWRDFHHASCQTNTWNNCASSGYNHGTSGLGVEVWQKVNKHGYTACLPRGWSYSNFAGLNWPGTSHNFNDTISANKWTSGC